MARKQDRAMLSFFALGQPDLRRVKADTITSGGEKFPMAFRLKSLLPVLALACVLAIPARGPAQTPATPAPPHTFTVSGRQFLLDGKPYQIISGEMHYTRIPRAYWRDRFRMARAMGLNTITTYVFWNVHEPRPGVFDFSGQNDVAEYIREAQEEGLHVILRPGPYVCAEWDLGGFPSWLLKDRSLILRSQDPKYLAAVEQWFTRLGKEIQPLLLQNGGPIIAIQVENEYGSFGNDHAYMEAVKDMLVKSGMDAPVLYTADGPEEIPNGSLPELPAVINFGTGDAEKSFAILHRLRPNGPSMSGEYWEGWFDHWGEVAPCYRRQARSCRAGMDAEAGLLGEPLHVPRWNQLWLDERRQQRRPELSARHHQLRLRRATR